MLKIIKPVLLFLLILAVLINTVWLKSPAIGLIASLAYFLIFGYLLGRILFNKFKSASQTILGIFSLTAGYSLLGAIVYYLYQLNLPAVSLLFIAVSSAIIILNRKKFAADNLELPNLATLYNLIKPNTTSYNPILLITYIILIAINFYLLWRGQTDAAINSPWQVITPAFFIVYFLATVNLILLTFYNKNYLTNILIGLHFFLTTGVALIIYKLGYGFDPFIHQATEQAIWQNGFILPKPFYYLGQYSLVILGANLMQISVVIIDKLLVPLILSIFLPYTIYFSFHQTFGWKKSLCRLLSLSFLFLPFELFIATNPQALANVLTIIIIFLSLLYLKNKQLPFYYLIILALSVLAIHALSGLPIIIYLILIFLFSRDFKFKKVIISGFAILSSLILPLALYVNSLISIYKIKFDLSGFNFINLPDIFSRQYNFFLDLAYIYKNIIYWAIAAIAVMVFFYLADKKRTKMFIAGLITFIILMINSYLLKTIKVDYIIANEQNFFADRVWQLSFYFLLPLLIYGLYLLFKKARQQKIAQAAILILIATAISSSLYLSYPRHDNYDDSKFVNLSKTDLAVAEFIENDSASVDYIVLANQMTSAAALKTYGFTRYYNGQYFYPIPTGGPLYQYFLDMVGNKTNQETMAEAMDLAGVKTAYFVLPDYWNRFKIIKEKAQRDAAAVYSIDDKYFIYKYIKN